MQAYERTSYDKNRQVLGKIYPLSTPFTIILDISEACNFRCSYCFRSNKDLRAWGDYAVKKELMHWDLFETAVNQLMEFPEEVKQISLSCHGEPMCNKNLPKMVKYIKSKGIKSRISIHTNASLLDERVAIELAESKIDKIVVSLQGLNAQSYNEICGFNIDYDKFYNNLKALYNNKSASTTINIKIVDVAVGNREEFFDKFSPIADNVFVEKVVPIWKDTGSSSKPKDMKNKFGDKFPYQECCPLIFNTIVVAPDGDVYPCTQILSEERLGNILEKSLLELWNSDMRYELLRRQLTLCPPESCNGCGIKQNSIFTKEDMIDDYREEILSRLNER